MDILDLFRRVDRESRKLGTPYVQQQHQGSRKRRDLGIKSREYTILIRMGW